MVQNNWSLPPQQILHSQSEFDAMMRDSSLGPATSIIRCTKCTFLNILWPATINRGQIAKYCLDRGQSKEIDEPIPQ